VHAPNFHPGEVFSELGIVQKGGRSFKKKKE